MNKFLEVLFSLMALGPSANSDQCANVLQNANLRHQQQTQRLSVTPIQHLTPKVQNRVLAELVVITQRLFDLAEQRNEESIFPLQPQVLEGVLLRDQKTGLSHVVLDQNGKVLGYVLAFPTPNGVHIEKLAVVEEAQNQKIGSRLLHAVANSATTNKIDSINLLVRKGNANAIQKYEHLGFRNLTPAHVRDDPRGNAFLYEVETSILLEATSPK